MYHIKFQNAVQVSAVKICVKYANDINDDVIHLTKYYFKYVNRAILANLHQRPLELGRLIVLKETHLRL